MDNALFHFYDLGIVAENKTLNSHQAFITPISILPSLDGELKVVNETLTHEGKDAQDTPYKVEVTARNAIVCDWLQWGSNRHTPPDLRRGERVFIYRYADTDQYYWVCPGLDDHLRRLETVVYLFSGLGDGTSDDPLTPDNSYMLEISTHNKVITLSTSMANEEVNRYTFQFNTAEGIVTLTDDLENYFQLESQHNRFTLINADQSHVIIDKQTIDVKCDDWFNVTAANSITVTTNTLTMDIGDTATLNTGAGTTFNIGDGFSVVCGGDIGMQAGNVAMKAGSIVMDGAMQVKSLAGLGGGDLKLTSAISSPKGATFGETVTGPDNSI